MTPEEIQIYRSALAVNRPNDVVAAVLNVELPHSNGVAVQFAVTRLIRGQLTATFVQANSIAPGQFLTPNFCWGMQIPFPVFRLIRHRLRSVRIRHICQIEPGGIIEKGTIH